MSKLSFGQANRGGGYWIHLAFILMLCVFAILKTGDLNTPYFWDELGVYVPGALAMKDNGTIGLLPSSLEPLYSRGHPLVFVFSQAAWFNLVGDTVVEGHVFSLLLGLITLGVFYICTADLFGKAVALFSSVLLAFQPMFFAMSGVILPEMMLTLFTIPAIWGLIRRRWLIYIVSASLAIMTKESAIIIPALALLVAGWDAVADRKIFSLRTLTACFSALFPLLVYGGFLLIQKKQNGWYFFPEHMGYLRLDSSLIDQGWNIFRDMFIRQGKLIIGPVLILGLFFHRSLISLHKRAVVISLLFVLAAMAFADLNFYLTRYMLYALPFVVACGTFFVFELAARFPAGIRKLALPLVVVVTLTASALTINTGTFRDTADMAYKDMVAAKLEAIRWVEQQPWRDSVIEANFPLAQAMQEMRNGYLSVRPFDLSVNYQRRASYGLLFHFEKDQNLVWDRRPYQVIRRWQMPYAYISAVRYPH